MAVNIYRSTDVGAPSLNQTVGSLLMVLDYVLVTNEGWTKPFSSGNVAVYRQPIGSNQMYLYVDDNIGVYANVRGYRTMSSLTAGTDPFPHVRNGSSVDSTNTTYITKHSGALGVRPWSVITNGKLFYLWINAANAVRPDAGLYCFGDFVTTSCGTDTQNTIIIAGDTTTQTANPAVMFNFISGAAYGPGHFVAGNPYNVGTSMPLVAGGATLRARKHGQPNMTDYYNGQYVSGAGGIAYPNPTTSNLLLARCYLFHTQAFVSGGSIGPFVRGYLPGIWAIGHNTALYPGPSGLIHGNTFSGAVGGELAGKTFEIFNISTNGAVAFETSNTW